MANSPSRLVSKAAKSCSEKQKNPCCHKLPIALSKAAIETLAIIAYHQPVTRAEIEDIRGVSLNKGTLDVLLETSWVRPMGRRRTPGRPMTYGTSEAFLVNFGLESIKDLPGLKELKAAGLLDNVNVALLNLVDPREEIEEQGELPVGS